MQSNVSDEEGQMFRVDSISLEEEEEAETDVDPYRNAGVPFSADLPHINS